MRVKFLFAMLLLLGVSPAWAQDEPEKEPEAYYVYSNGRITFYYDNLQDERVYDDYSYEDVYTIAFDESYANYRPTHLGFINPYIVGNHFGFSCFPNLTAIVGLKNLNTSNITDMSYIFWGCERLRSLDLSHFNTSNVTNMSSMFAGCSSLTSLDVSNFNTSKVTSIRCMFVGCSSLTSLDLSNFDTRNVTDMEGMFEGCSSLTSLDLSHFNTQNVTNMEGMFQECSGLTSIDVTNFDTRNVEGMATMFGGCSGLTSLDVTIFDTRNVTRMGGLFFGCSGLTSIDVSNFDTKNVELMCSMFAGCSNLTSIDVSNFETSNTTDLSCMFEGCSGLTSIDVSNFNTSKVTNMIALFQDCSGLTSIDVSNFDTKNVEWMGAMFTGCSGLTSINVSNFDTSNVTYMSGLFDGCSGLTSIDVSNFDTRKVTRMSEMFKGCSNLTSLDLRNFDTSNVWDMKFMFADCPKLKKIYCDDIWSLSESEFPEFEEASSENMFFGCSSLPGYAEENANDVTYACPDGYFIKTARTVTTSIAFLNNVEYHWSTYYDEAVGVTADANATVFTAKLNDEGTALILTVVPDRVIPAGNAVVLRSTSETVTLSLNEEATGTLPDNALRGSYTKIATNSVEGTVYTLAAEGGNLGFYKYTGETLAARKAFLVTDAATRCIAVRYSDEATAIATVNATNNDKPAASYDLSGRRIQPTTRGLHISNGKKYVRQ